MRDYPPIDERASWPVIAQRIRDVLTRNNMTAAELGRLLGVQNSTVSSWLVGRRRPTADNAYLLGLLGGCPENYYRHETRPSPERSRGTRLAAHRVEGFMRRNRELQDPHTRVVETGTTGDTTGVLRNDVADCRPNQSSGNASGEESTEGMGTAAGIAVPEG